MNSDSTNIVERRCSNRIVLRIPTKARLIETGPADEYQEMVTRDINESGAYFFTAKPFPLYSEIKVILDMGKTMVRAMGRVVRQEPGGMAVAFSSTKLEPVLG